MSELKRYELSSEDGKWESYGAPITIECEDGDYVKHEDVKTYPEMLEVLIENYKVMFNIWDAFNLKDVGTVIEKQMNLTTDIIEKATNQKIEDLL